MDRSDRRAAAPGDGKFVEVAIAVSISDSALGFVQSLELPNLDSDHLIAQAAALCGPGRPILVEDVVFARARFEEAGSGYEVRRVSSADEALEALRFAETALPPDKNGDWRTTAALIEAVMDFLDNGEPLPVAERLKLLLDSIAKRRWMARLAVDTKRSVKGLSYYRRPLRRRLAALSQSR